MHASPLQGVLDHLRRLTDPNRSRELNDADLLERFRLRREESAFTLLVQRHGPLVLNVCRRILGDVHEAEDAFQATFLVLVRKADTIHKQQSLAGWLHRVAMRLALKARAQSARRQRCEREVIPPTMQENSFDALAAGELRAALDEEIERLPEIYRTPLVLCYLTDKTHEQAAKELGWPKSSVTARLAKARQMLQQRLIRRGFTAPAGVVAILLTETAANAALPSVLTLSTVRLAMSALLGKPLAATATIALADSIAKGTGLTKWFVALALMTALSVAAVAPLCQNTGSPTEKPASAVKPQPDAVKAEPRKPRLDWQGDPLPDGAIARMGSGRLRHPFYFRQLAFSDDGKSLVSASDNGIRFWDTATGKLQRRLNVSGTRTAAFAFTAEGMLVANSDYAMREVHFRVFDRANGEVRRKVVLPHRATSYLTLSREGKWLIYSGDNNAYLHDTTNGREVLRLPPGRDFAFSPDGKTVALCDYSDAIRIYNTADGTCTRRLQHKGDHIVRLSISADGRFLVSLSSNNGQVSDEAGVWDLRSGKELRRLKGDGDFVLSAALSPDSKYVALGSTHPDLLLLDRETGKEVRRFPTDAFFAGIAFSSDGKKLAAASGTGTIRLWETETGRVLPASADPMLDSIGQLHFSGDGRRLLGHAGIHFAWDVQTGRELRRFPRVAERDWIGVLSPDESLLASADNDGTIRLWDAKTGRAVRALKGHEKWVRYMIFSPDGRYLISSGGADGTIRVWDVAAGREINKINNKSEGNCHVISPDGRWLASACGSNEVVVWDIASGREKARFALHPSKRVYQLAFSSDSRLLAAGDGGRNTDQPGEVHVWHVDGEPRHQSFQGHKERITSVAFAPDQRTLATGDRKGDVFLWELAGGRRRHRFVGHENSINWLAFSPDGHTLAAASYDAPVYLWDVSGSLEHKPRRLSNEDLQRAWTTLAAEDAKAAFQSIRRLATAPEQTLPLLRQHLKPVPTLDPKQVRQRVQMLDSDDFTTRQKASEELEKQADAAAALLRQIVTKEKPSLEVRRRVQQLLDGIDGKPEALRAVRAIEVLEWIGTTDAVRLIGELATGATEARLTREAVAAKRRLTR